MMPNPVTAIPAAPPSEATRYFTNKLSLETDCWDVQQALREANPAFVVLDTRSRAAYAQGHVPGAISLQLGEITAERMLTWPHQTLFIVYCAGPHSKSVDRAALKLAELGCPVKTMVGGMAVWAAEGFPLEICDEFDA
jgi:rhodanese-related sulfurtransferase